MKNSIEGTIVKGIAGFYFVKSGDTVYRCRARGIFKERGIKPAVGDKVNFEFGEEEDNRVITEILPRGNCFIRPFVSNVDCFIVVAAAAKPKPVAQVIDRFLVMAERAKVDVVLCINKCDLTGSQKELQEIYSPLYPVVCLSSNGMKRGKGEPAPDEIDRLKELIRGKKSALAGASGVGKSTIINRIVPDAMMEIGDISEKSQRGKHTTRHSQLFDLRDGHGTMVFDTPGFTSFDIMQIGEGELQLYYPEIAKLTGGCRYDDCRHLAEPGCAVKEALKRGEINMSRYKSYKIQMEELMK